MEEIPYYDKITLQYVGIFDFDGLYAAIIDWAKNYGYTWQESVYKHKVPSPTGAEQEMTWKLELDVTEYLRYEIVFTVHIWDMLEVQVEDNGKKKSLTTARIYIWIEPKMILDWQKKYEGKKWFKLLGKWYNKAIGKEIEGNYADTLWYRTNDLYALIKKFFDLQSKKYAYKGYLGEN